MVLALLAVMRRSIMPSVEGRLALRLRTWLQLGAFVVVLSGACSSDPVSGVDWEGVEAQWSGGFRTDGVTSQLWVLVVDDAPTERARALRTQLANEVLGFLDSWRADDCTRRWDHAQHWPQRVQVLLIPSSDPSAALHAGVRAGLELDTANARSATDRAWEEELADAIMGLESEEERPNLVLAGLAYWGDLLSEARAPASDAEEAFLAGLPSDRWTTVLSFGTRDDESESSAMQISFGSLYGGEAKLDGECASGEGRELAPRLNEALPVTCGAPYLRSNLACDLRPTCQHRWPTRSESGQVDCRALVNIDAAAGCPPEFGWLDPLAADGVRRPRWLMDPEGLPSGQYRQCEIRQLDGPPRAACENDFECVGCEPGFCFRGHFEDQPHDYLVRQCADRGAWSAEQFRFVLGAGSAQVGWGTVQCDIDPATEQ